MTFEEWSERENYALTPEGNTFDTNILRECWEYSRLSALEEAAKHVKLMETSLGSTDYNEGWNAALELIMGDLKALARPLPGTGEKHGN